VADPLAELREEAASCTRLAELREEAASCTRCSLFEGRTQVVFGVGDPGAALMFVGEAPGRDEDLAGEPFVGRSGKLLDRLMREEIGVTRDQVYIANVVKCRPPSNRDPKPEEVASCGGYLMRQIDLVSPAVVVTLGNFATRALLSTTDGIGKLRGRSYPYRASWLVPTYHPAAALRGGGDVMAQMRADFVRAKRSLHETAPSTTDPGLS